MIGLFFFFFLIIMNLLFLEWNILVLLCVEVWVYLLYLFFVVRIYFWNFFFGIYYGFFVNIGGIFFLIELEKKILEFYKVLIFVFCLFEFGVYFFLILCLFWRFCCSVFKFFFNLESFLFKVFFRKLLKWKKMNGWRKKINN